MSAKPPKDAIKIGPFAALLVSALILPGLGQILSGRRLRGAIMAGALALALPLVILKIALDLAAIWPSLAAKIEAGQTATLADIQAATAPLAGGLVWPLLPVMGVWLWSLADNLVFLWRGVSKPAAEIGRKGG